MIDVVGLSKRYGELLAVDNVEFSIERGETFGLLGPNGAGKSTTIAMLVGLLRPDSGSVRMDGVSDWQSPAGRRSIGVAPQANAFYSELTARENLAFFGRLYGLTGPPLRERAEWALDFVGLKDRADDRAAHYSGGMKRRLNLGCALVHDPEIIVLDEPTVGVDPQSRNFIFDNIEALQKLGRTILYTTHYMEEVERLCDRVAIMDRGRIVALDTVSKLIERHGGDAVVELELDDGSNGAGAIMPQGAVVQDGVVRLQTANPQKAIGDLFQSGLAFRQLHVRRPNLESVFLSLTGRQLRD